MRPGGSEFQVLFVAGQGKARRGEARLGEARRGRARRGAARQGEARVFSKGEVRRIYVD